MEKTMPVRGQRGWIVRKLLGNYWSLSIMAIIAAVPVSLGILWLDRAGLTAAILSAGLAPVARAHTALDFAGVAAGINAAFISLYFSITLIVLSLAAQSLGPRLIDRWLSKQLVRVSVAVLAFSLVVSLVALLTIDGEAPLSQVPLGLVALTFALQLITLALLAVSLHDLGRTMLVDRSIAAIQRGAAQPPVEIMAQAPLHGNAWHIALRSPREGYVQGMDLAGIARHTAGIAGVRVCAAPGQHVMRGDPLVRVMQTGFDGEDLAQSIPIDDWRSDAQGSVFRIRLLIEIAARALSPGINDFYTAITCADALAVAMRGHRSCWVPEGEVACWAEDRRIELPGQDFASLFLDPLNALRQSACDYPSVAIRMIDNYRRLALADREAGDTHPEYIAFLLERARELRDHAMERAQMEVDRAAIAQRFAAFEESF